jgi:4-hydroxy-3-methylbut-2-en-1-yl diphosphate reductase
VLPTLPGTLVVRSGVGPARSVAAAARAVRLRPDAVAVAGFCGATAHGLRPGDVVVASEVRGPAGVTACASGPLVEALAACGSFRVHVGPVACSARPVVGAARAAFAAQGVIAADMESAWLAAAAAGRPFAVLRVVLDSPERELYRPLASLSGAVTAWRALRRAAPALAVWARAASAERSADPRVHAGQQLPR